MAAHTTMDTARIVWHGEQPESATYGDIYHAPDFEREVVRVFVEPARLADKAREAARRDRTLRIGEIGFGTALNLAACARLSLRHGCRLHFFSVEAQPLTQADFSRIARQRNRQYPIYGELATAWPPPLPGWHRRYLAEGRITLSVFWGPANQGLADLVERQRQPMDAWLLDGFAPDRNPDAWRDDLLRMLARLCAHGATLATFTAAGRVRRSLEQVGFHMRRVDQRPHKRESLAGVWQGRRSAGQERPRLPQPKRVSVAGAGIAGACIARLLASAGVTVDVFDPAPGIGAGGSSMPVTLLHPRLPARRPAEADQTHAWRAHAYAFSRAWLSQFAGFVASGVLQGSGSTEQAERAVAIAGLWQDSGLALLLDADEASRRCAWPLDRPTLLFPDAGMIAPARLLAALLDHPAIRLHPGCPALASERPLALACANAVRQWPQAADLELAPVHGQMDLTRMDAPPRLPLAGHPCIIPDRQGVVLGATYEQAPWAPDAASAANLATLDGRSHQWLGRFRATRSVSSDRNPVVGRVDDGLFVSTGHGSTGMQSAPFAAAAIVSEMLGDLSPLDAAALLALHPDRFRARQARRGYRFGATAVDPNVSPRKA